MFCFQSNLCRYIMESDLLLLLLRRLLLTRTDLRIVLMSATADADLFADYFSLPGRGGY
jgi:ATP-dependent RNA helicase DHX57